MNLRQALCRWHGRHPNSQNLMSLQVYLRHPCCKLVRSRQMVLSTSDTTSCHQLTKTIRFIAINCYKPSNRLMTWQLSTSTPSQFDNVSSSSEATESVGEESSLAFEGGVGDEL